MFIWKNIGRVRRLGRKAEQPSLQERLDLGSPANSTDSTNFHPGVSLLYRAFKFSAKRSSHSEPGPEGKWHTFTLLRDCNRPLLSPSRPCPPHTLPHLLIFTSPFSSLKISSYPFQCHHIHSLKILSILFSLSLCVCVCVLFCLCGSCFKTGYHVA